MGLTLPTLEQVSGDNALDVIKQSRASGRNTQLTDLVKIFGGNPANGSLWTASFYNNGNVRNITMNGHETLEAPYQWESAQLVLPPSITSKIGGVARSLSFKEKVLKGVDPEIEVRQYGGYPQTVGCYTISKKLERYFNDRNLQTIDNYYTFDRAIPFTMGNYFKPVAHPECRYNGQPYIRVIANELAHAEMSNGETPKAGEPYWVKVQPIDWLVDKSGYWITLDAPLGTLRFHYDNYYDNDFGKTDIKKYLDDYVTPQMLQNYNAFMSQDILIRMTPWGVQSISRMLPEEEPTHPSSTLIEKAAKIFTRLMHE
ncbi:MAG: hypothetical protein FWF23_05710 [Alphaproteobacteria bacterium]|nr:hypothetical protein [Alphaproteobacteria bacterium]MCL2505949.1 hypothetical protein [Alphaproteobacteria bacterium]